MLQLNQSSLLTGSSSGWPLQLNQFGFGPLIRREVRISGCSDSAMLPPVPEFVASSTIVGSGSDDEKYHDVDSSKTTLGLTWTLLKRGL